MKRYIRASYDSSMPSWLKGEAGKQALASLNNTYAMSRATFSKYEQPGSIPIYLLDDTYKEESRWGETYKTPAGQYVYVPNVSGGYGRFIPVGRTFRALGTAAKARIQEHIIDTVYMTAPLRKEVRPAEDRYQDPRYEKEYDWDSHRYKQVYQGQYPEYRTEWSEEAKDWVDTNEVESWEIQGNGRDKSGYEIPDPTELYKRLYNRFPERLKGRVQEARNILDEYYDKVDEAKSLIFSQYDIRKGKGISLYGETYKNVLYFLNEAVKDYGWLYEGFEKCMKDDGSIDTQKLASFLKSGDTFAVPRLTREIDNYVGKINKQLRR